MSEVKHLEEETSKDRSSHNQEDTRPEPRGGGLRRVWVTGRELLVHLDSSDQSDDGTDGVDQFRSRVEIGGDHFRGLVDTRQPVALREGGGGEGKQ